jgi:hypothetical protein
MTQRKKESALGRGLDALIRKDIDEVVEEPKNIEKSSKTKKTSKKRSNPPISDKKLDAEGNIGKPRGSKNISRSNDTNINDDLVESVMLEVHKNPRISLWSAKSAAVLRLLKKTKPEFSISKEASALIEDAVKDKYPDLWDVFEEKEL